MNRLCMRSFAACTSAKALQKPSFLRFPAQSGTFLKPRLFSQCPGSHHPCKVRPSHIYKCAHMVAHRAGISCVPSSWHAEGILQFTGRLPSHSCLTPSRCKIRHLQYCMSSAQLCQGLGQCMPEFQCKPCAVQRVPTDCTCSVGTGCAASQEGISSPNGLHLPEAGNSVKSLGACIQLRLFWFTDAPQHKIIIAQTAAFRPSVARDVLCRAALWNHYSVSGWQESAAVSAVMCLRNGRPNRFATH